MSDECRGWGCRLLMVIPDKLPTTERERGKLFSKVYMEAEKLGVINCPHFEPTLIDEVVESRDELTAIMEQNPL